MKEDKPMTIRARYKSFNYAFTGFTSLLKNEPNMRIHMVATMAAIILGIAKHISSLQWVAIVFAIALVWITEAVNTAIENLCNLYSKEYNPAIKVIKDISAFAVLAAAIASAVVGILVFFF